MNAAKKLLLRMRRSRREDAIGPLLGKLVNDLIANVWLCTKKGNN